MTIDLGDLDEKLDRSSMQLYNFRPFKKMVGNECGYDKTMTAEER